MKTLEFREGALWLLDQTRLPHEAVLVQCVGYQDVADAIRTMKVRGAPAIGLAAAYGVVLAAQRLAYEGIDASAFDRGMEEALTDLAATRPTAVNLFWALERMRRVLAETPPDVVNRLRHEADALLAADESANRRMGDYGSELVPDGANVLTHCNAGALATGAYGTALGVIRAAHDSGKRVHVWVDETRPLFQGARLTAWELQELGIPHTVITDSMAGHFMARGRVDLAIVGADRIAANGDVANKIGTYGVATLARAHDIPFYVAAPLSTVDLATSSGRHITLEERRSEEVSSPAGVPTTPAQSEVANPAFDVTPARLVTAIITEVGVIRPPLPAGLSDVASRSNR